MFCRECGRKISSDRCPYCGKNNITKQEEKEIQADSAVQEYIEEAIPVPPQGETFHSDCRENTSVQPYLGGYNPNDTVSHEQWSNESSTFSYSYQTGKEESNRSRSIAALLQIFLGAFGVGRFYMGYIGIGIAQIMVTLVTCGICGLVWGFVDGVLILSGTPARDADGNMLKN